MHHIYETEAFVLAASPSGEADKRFLLYTRQFGLIHATAKGVREVKSKLRYSLQMYSFSVVNLVHGRGGWRLTNAQLLKNLYSNFRTTPETFVVVARVFSLLRRMLHGEEKQVSLFDTLTEGFSFLGRLSRASVGEFEPLLVLRILYHLGYVGASSSLSPFLQNDRWNEEVLKEVSRHKQQMFLSINESLRASQL